MEIENHMVLDSHWPDREKDDDLPVCDCCEERIRQFTALHIPYGKKRVWICDRCIEEMKEVTGN